MFRYAMMLCLLAVVKGDDDEACCSHGDREAVLNTWDTIWNAQYNERRVTIGKETFKR